MAHVLVYLLALYNAFPLKGSGDRCVQDAYNRNSYQRSHIVWWQTLVPQKRYWLEEEEYVGNHIAGKLVAFPKRLTIIDLIK